MEYVFLGIVVFLFLLAIFDLSVGVSNDAVNFLNSAIGSKAARFKTAIIIAALGVFIGAVMSNGMMEIARHGIFRPEHFTFMDLMCIFMTVMVIDIILLDVFNTLGMPTSTTVSMVFELLGATFAISLFKLASSDTAVGLSELLNTEKALSVIIGIFLSVAIAFFFGTLVQYLTRLWFSFNYKKGLTWKIGIFGGISITAIIYFLLLKGAKDLAFMTPEVKGWISDNTVLILTGCMVTFTIVCQILHLLKVNVFKVVVLSGTFALAMAFAGNDLVNFIGVPLAGFSSYQDWMASGAPDPNSFLMGSLNGPATTPLIFLLIAGTIMVIALATSKKAQKVLETSVNLSRQDSSDEMFGSSRLARRLVRVCIATSEKVVDATPQSVRNWVSKRFDTNQAIIEDGAAFDLVRGSINLVLAGALIAFGTSLKLPLSTTYVTFMVAMGTSLADRAWGRESAVFRITGVISVIGGWFITAGVAFICAAIMASLIYLGGIIAMFCAALIAIAILVHNNLKKREKKAQGDNTLFQTIIHTDDAQKSWELLKIYIINNQKDFLRFSCDMQHEIVNAFFNDNASKLGKAVNVLAKHKSYLKSTRRKSTLCMKQVPPAVAIEYNTWFHLINHSQMSMLYNLRRIAEVTHEHVDNNFRRLPHDFVKAGGTICTSISDILEETISALELPTTDDLSTLRHRCDAIKDSISAETRRIYEFMHHESADNMAVLYVYLNLLQEQQELISSLRKLLRADIKLSQGGETHTRYVTTAPAQA